MMQSAFAANTACKITPVNTNGSHSGAHIAWVNYAKGAAILGVFVMHSAYSAGWCPSFPRSI